MQPDLVRLEAQRTFQAALQRQLAMLRQDAGDRLVPVARMAEDFADLSRIEAAADQILSDIGLRFEGDPETLELLNAAGFPAKGDCVRLDGPALRRLIATHAPRQFVLRARNPSRSLTIGQGMVCAPAYGAPTVLTLTGDRRAGNLSLYQSLVSMAHAAEGIGNTGHLLCVLNDQPEPLRPFQMALAHLELSDKTFMGPVSSPQDLVDVSVATEEVIALPPGLGACNLLHLINATPPLTYKANPLKCLRAAAERGEGCVVTSYMMMGATSPVTIAGTLAQGYAEVMAGLALCQLWRPGAPVIAGIFGTPFDMQHMIPRFGDPATALIQHLATALARRLGVPVRGDGGVSSAKSDDAQAGYDGGAALMHCQATGADFVLHAAGWLEQGRTMGLAKFRREAMALPPSGPALLPHAADPRLMADLRHRWGLRA